MTRLFADSINNYTPSGGFSSVLISFSSCCSSYSGPGSESFLASSLMAASFWAASSENRNKGDKSLKKKSRNILQITQANNGKYRKSNAYNYTAHFGPNPVCRRMEDHGQVSVIAMTFADNLCKQLGPRSGWSECRS